MAGAKPWQIVLIVAAIILVIGSVYYTLSGGDTVTTADEIMLVDASTGQRFVASVRGRGITIPAVHPDTQKPSLIPVSQDEQGRWVVSSRELGTLKNLKIETTAVLDPRTGEVRVTEDKPRKLR